MFKRALFVAFPLCAVMGPMAFFSGPEWIANVASSLSASLTDDLSSSLPAGASAQMAVRTAEVPAGDGPGAAVRNLPGNPYLLPLEGASVSNFAEVLRFDVTPAWVVSRWPRVSSGLGQLELQGYRVPLVTGTAEDDLAGALTYYFNSQHQVQRIRFEGSTGDYRKLAQLLTAYYGFAARPTNTPKVILFEVPVPDAKAKSFLWIQPSPVLQSDQPHNRFEVTMVLERPAGV